MLYQFKRLTCGAVEINGPHDRYGLIIKKQDSGTYLIRGTGDEIITPEQWNDTKRSEAK